MSLQNLVGVSLERVEPSAKTIARLLAAARRLLDDARAARISPETRFGAGYSAIRIVADAGLNAHGFRTLTSRPGHHQTAIQSLTKTFGLAAETIVILDALRKQRHLVEYTGEAVPESTVDECVEQASGVIDAAVAWLHTNRPEQLER